MADEMTYEEAAILNWYKTRKAYLETATGDEKHLEVYKAYDAAEDALIQIGMDLNVGPKK